jgi:hypothetical protein
MASSAYFQNVCVSAIAASRLQDRQDAAGHGRQALDACAKHDFDRLEKGPPSMI